MSIVVDDVMPINIRMDIREILNLLNEALGRPVRASRKQKVTKTAMDSNAAKYRYEALQRELSAVEEATGLLLADENVDVENVGAPPEQAPWDATVEECDIAEAAMADWWTRMVNAACSAAGQRAENEGQNINTLLGRTIY